MKLLTSRIKYGAQQIVNYVIEYSNEKDYSLNNLRLAKILYFIQGFTLLEEGCPAFYDKFEAWTYGPTLANIYMKYSCYGPQELGLKDVGRFVYTMDSWDPEEYDKNQLDNNMRQRIEMVVDKLSKLEYSEIVDICHTHPAWIEAFNSDKILKNESILETFQSLGDNIWNY